MIFMSRDPLKVELAIQITVRIGLDLKCMEGRDA